MDVLQKYMMYAKLQRACKKFFATHTVFLLEDKIKSSSIALNYNVNKNEVVKFTNSILRTILFNDELLRLRDYNYLKTILERNRLFYTIYYDNYHIMTLYAELCNCIINVLKEDMDKESRLCLLNDDFICKYSISTNIISIGLFDRDEFEAASKDGDVTVYTIKKYELNDLLINKDTHNAFVSIINNFKFYEDKEECEKLLNELRINYKKFIVGDFDKDISYIKSFDNHNMIVIRFDILNGIVLYKAYDTDIYSVYYMCINDDYYQKKLDTMDNDNDAYLYRIYQLMIFDKEILSLANNDILRKLSDITIN